MWLLIALVSTAAKPSPVSSPVFTSQAAESRYESANFVVQSHIRPSRADEVARLGEAVCCRLRRQCSGSDAAPSWQPKCEVILHRTRQSYLAAVGEGGRETVGSSVVQIDGGRVLRRRIDLLAEDWNRALSALPHEMVHVLFAEIFPEGAPPLWAEEGFALLNDPGDKRARHSRDLDRAVRTGTAIPFGELFSATAYPRGWQRAVFYGQSMSLVEYLIGLDTPQQFVNFVKLSMDKECNHGLKTVYEIDGLDDLQRRWYRHVIASFNKAS